MITSRKLAMAGVLASAAWACSSDSIAPSTSGPMMDPSNPMTDPNADPVQIPVTERFVPTPQQALDYMRYLGPSLLGRVLTDAEETRITAEAEAAIKPLVEAWVLEPGFAEAIRSMLETQIGSNGVRGAADFNLPGYIVRHVVRNQLPWSQVVTSTSCYDADDVAIPCDTGAPYTAGVLTTKGFLTGNEGRFNLGRARAMLLSFMCRDYPHEEALQPLVDKPKLKLMFRASNAAEQMVAEVAGGFGNGLACYTCHGQFSSHSQPFVKFDKNGNYVATATGVQSMTGQLGESEEGLMASHWENPAEAGLENAQWFGQEITNLATGAAVMAATDTFRECAVQQLLELGVGLDASYDNGLEDDIKGLYASPRFLEEIAGAVQAVSPDPTIQALAIAAYSDMRVVAATLNGLKR
jgi:hypothetical protein